MSNGDGFASKPHTQSKKGRISLKTQGRGVHFGKQLHFSNDFTKDHVIPKARGGELDFTQTVHGQAFVRNV